MAKWAADVKVVPRVEKKQDFMLKIKQNKETGVNKCVHSFIKRRQMSIHNLET